MSQLFYEVILLNIIVLFIYVGFYFYGSNEKKLMVKGYSKEYITFIRSDEKKRTLITLFVFIIVQLLVALIGGKIIGQLTIKTYFLNIMIWSLLFALAIDLFQIKNANKNLKKIAAETKSNIIVDFDFKTLKLIFSLPLEIPVSIVTILYAIIFMDKNLSISMYVFLLWFYYITLRRSKYLNKSMFYNNYSGLGSSLFIFQFVILLSFAGTGIGILEDGKPFKQPIIYVLIFIAMILKIIYYAKNYRTFKEKVAETAPEIEVKL